MCDDAGMVQLPPAVARAAKAFGLDTGSLRELGGNSGSAWGAGNRVLRVGRPAVIDAELAASSAVAAVVPVPAVLDRADAGDASAVLLEILPGQPVAQFARHRPELARAAGQACGTVHALLAGVPAPAGLRAVPGPDRGTPAGAPRVLHLDLHPLNVLAGAGRILMPHGTGSPRYGGSASATRIAATSTSQVSVSFPLHTARAPTLLPALMQGPRGSPCLAHLGPITIPVQTQNETKNGRRILSLPKMSFTLVTVSDVLVLVDDASRPVASPDSEGLEVGYLGEKRLERSGA